MIRDIKFYVFYVFQVVFSVIKYFFYTQRTAIVVFFYNFFFILNYLIFPVPIALLIGKETMLSDRRTVERIMMMMISQTRNAFLLHSLPLALSLFLSLYASFTFRWKMQPASNAISVAFANELISLSPLSGFGSVSASACCWGLRRRKCTKRRPRARRTSYEYKTRSSFRFDLAAAVFAVSPLVTLSRFRTLQSVALAFNTLGRVLCRALERCDRQSITLWSSSVYKLFSMHFP